MPSDPVRLASAALAALASVGALFLLLFDWHTALLLLAALIGGWALVIAAAVGRGLYARHRVYVLGAAAIVILALLVVLRPDGSGGEDSPESRAVTAYGAELWPNRLTREPSFILRERLEWRTSAGETAVADGRANLAPVSTGALMRELRFPPGAASGAGAIRLADEGESTVVVNPLDDGAVHHARGGDVDRVELPIGQVVRVRLDELPRELRVAYLTDAGRSFGWLASLVTPLRRMPLPFVLALFALLGALATRAWSDFLLTPLRRRLGEKPAPTAGPGQSGPPGRPGAPIERVPLTPRRK